MDIQALCQAPMAPKSDCQTNFFLDCYFSNKELPKES